MARRTVTPLVSSCLLAALAACAAPSPSPLDPPRETRVVPEARDYDARFYEIDFTLDFEQRQIEGTVRMQFVVTRPTDRLLLDAAGMEILDVAAQVDPPRGQPAAAYDGRTVHAVFPGLLPAGASGTLELRYRARPAAGLYFIDPASSGFAHPPQVYTQGECEDARHWFPCNDRPDDRAGHSISATVPASWTTVAAGDRIAESAAGPELKRVTWRMAEEMPTYLYTFAAGPFAVVEEAWGEVAVQYVVEVGDAAAAAASLGMTPDVLGYFSEYTGFPYPFRKYATTAVRDFPYGGMENVTATTITRSALASPGHQEEFSARGLVAHEAAHQWFGDVVTCASWPHIWLNEGFASYFAALYEGEAAGTEAFLYRTGEMIDGYTRACRGAQRRALVKHEYRAPMDLFFDGTVYPGGALRLHLLRGWIGEEAFRAVIRHYLQANAFRSVDSEAFRRSLEAVTGQDFASFFEQWVYGPGYPELELEWSSTAEELVLDLRQVHEIEHLDAACGPAAAAFRFPLDFWWRSGGVWHRERAWIDQRRQTLRVPAGGAPAELLVVDPEAWLPAVITVEEPAAATRARLLASPSVRDRCLALRRLDAGKETAALWQAALGDPVPWLRRDAAAALPAAELGRDVVQALEAYHRELHWAPRLSWLERIAEHGGEPAAAALLAKLLAAAEASPNERAVALRARAAALQGAELESFLEPWLAAESPQELLRKAAMSVVAERYPASAALERLLAFAGPGHDAALRGHALALLEPWLERAPPPRLLELYRASLAAPSNPLRRSAAAVVARHGRWFREAIRERLLVEPDARIRRLLEKA